MKAALEILKKSPETRKDRDLNILKKYFEHIEFFR